MDIKLLGSVKDFRCQSVMDRYDNDNGDDKCGLPNQVLQFGLVSSSICKPTASTWFGKLNYLQPLSWQAMSMEISNQT